MVENIDNKTLSIHLRRKNPEAEDRTMLIDISDISSNTRDVVNMILDGPLRLLVDDLNVTYDHGNVKIKGAQVGDRDEQWEEAYIQIKKIINTNK